jgi:hypothetical protein
MLLDALLDITALALILAALRVFEWVSGKG